MSSVCWSTSTISKLTTLDPWKRVKSEIHSSCHSHDTILVSPWAPLAAVSVSLENMAPYPMRLRQYTSSRIFVSVEIMTLYFPHSAALIACGGPKPRPSLMLYIPRLSPVGWGGRHCGNGAE